MKKTCPWKLDGSTRKPKNMPRCMAKKKEWRTINFVSGDDLEFTRKEMLAKGWELHSHVKKMGWKYTMKFWRWM